MLEAQLGPSFRNRLLFLGLMTFGVGALLIHFVSKRYVRQLGPEGITLRNGQVFAWPALQGVRGVYTRRRTLSHVLLVFESGTVGVFFQVFENGGEVLDFVRQATRQELPLRLPLPA